MKKIISVLSTVMIGCTLLCAAVGCDRPTTENPVQPRTQTQTQTRTQDSNEDPALPELPEEDGEQNGTRPECPDGKCPDGKCPDGKCPDDKCPDDKCPDGKCPDGKCPDGKHGDRLKKRKGASRSLKKRRAPRAPRKGEKPAPEEPKNPEEPAPVPLPENGD